MVTLFQTSLSMIQQFALLFISFNHVDTATLRLYVVVNIALNRLLNITIRNSMLLYSVMPTIDEKLWLFKIPTSRQFQQ